MTWKILGVLVLLYGGYHTWQSRPVTHGDGVIASEAPQQHTIYNAAAINMDGYQITLLATISIRARVLSTENYNFGRDANLSPVDFALGWGPMSDEAILEQINISQGNRFFYWYVDQFPIPREDIESNAANMHMVPIDRKVKAALKSVRVGQVVNIEGYLIQAEAADGWHWTSSLTRYDTGYGACELVLVKSIHIN